MIARASARIPRLSRVARHAALLALVALAASGVSAQTLFMRMDGVKGESPANQPLGSDAFAMLNFSVSTEGNGEPGSGKPGARFGDVSFNVPLSGPAIALWQLAAERKEVPKASFAAVDAASGKLLYRVDLEQLVVQSMALQTLGKRSAGTGVISYQRIRIRYGGDDGGPSASWDRAKNAPWK